jgi:hypothetical protein
VFDIDGDRYRFNRVEHVSGNSMILMDLVQPDDPEFRKVVYNPKDFIGNYIEQNLAKRNVTIADVVDLGLSAESSGRGASLFEIPTRDPQEGLPTEDLGQGAQDSVVEPEDLGQGAQGVDLSDLSAEDMMKACGLDPADFPKEKSWEEKIKELDSVPIPDIKVGPHLEPGEILGTRQKKLKVAK